MTAKAFLYLVAAALTFVFGKVFASAATVEFKVSGASNLTCNAYLHIPEGVTEKLPLIFNESGNGIYTTKDDSALPSVSSKFFNAKKAVVLTLDKPGIVPNFSAKSKDKRSAIAQDEIFNFHTQKDLIACAQNALTQIANHKNVNIEAGFIMIGHSEGAQVTSNLFMKLVRERSPLAEKVKEVLLVGTPLDTWTVGANKLFTQSQKTVFWDAYNKQDNVRLRKIWDIGYSYWADILPEVSLEDKFKSFAAEFPNQTTQIHFYHGLKDSCADVTTVKSLEAWNASQVKLGTPHLNMVTHYYNTDHWLDFTAVDEIAADLATILTN